MGSFWCRCGQLIDDHLAPSPFRRKLFTDAALEEIVEELTAAADAAEVHARFDELRSKIINFDDRAGVEHVVQCPSCNRMLMFRLDGTFGFTVWALEEGDSAKG